MAETIKIGGELESTATGNVVAAASAIKDKVKNKYQGEINAETDASLADRYTKAETYNRTELNSMITTPNQQYVSVTANSQTTAVTDVLPATGAADTTYRVGNWDGTQYNDSVFSEYAWNGSAYIKLSTKSQVGEVYDISANHADTKYADLAAALGTNGANIPQNLRKGGMSVKFVQSSDNKYVQFRCIADEFTTDVTKWAVFVETILVDSPEFIKTWLGDDGGVIAGLKKNGDVYFAYGVPTQVKDYVYKQISQYYAVLKEEVDNAVEELQEQVEETLEEAEETLGYFESKDSQEWLNVTTDNTGGIIKGIKKDGTRRGYTKSYEKELSAERIEVHELKVTGNAELTDEIVSKIHSNNINDGSVKALYPKYEWEGYLANLATTKNLGAINDRTYKPLVLLHFSDIHNDDNGFKRILDFHSMYKKYIDDVLLSGDIAGGDWQSYSSNMTNLKGFYDVLKIIGNHDVYNYGGTSGLTATEAQCFARYMQGIENWGVQYTNDVCYWYKDYVHNTGTKDNFNGSAFDNTVNYTQGSLVIYDNKYYKAKGALAAGEFNLDNWVEITSFGIRLIGLDFMHRSVAQQTWLIATLADALTKGLSVIITTHGTPYLNDNTAAYFDTPFDSHDEWLPKAKNTSMTPSDVIEAVSNFIDNGGEFICYLSGHIHTDKCGYFKAGSAESNYVVRVDDNTYYYNKYKQVFIVIGLAKANGDVIYDYESDGQPELDIQKIVGTKTLDLFNIESFDTETKTISVLRVGCDIDRLLRSRRSMVIDYKNSELLYTR